jgi:hypothetical protein
VIDAFFLILAWYAVAAGLVLIFLGLIGREPSGFSLGLAIGVEAGLLVQLILSIVLVLLDSCSHGSDCRNGMGFSRKKPLVNCGFRCSSSYDCGDVGQNAANLDRGQPFRCLRLGVENS